MQKLLWGTEVKDMMLRFIKDRHSSEEVRALTESVFILCLFLSHTLSLHNQFSSSFCLSHTLTCTHYIVKLTRTCLIALTAKVTENKTAWLMLLWQEMLQADLVHYIYIPSLSPLSNCNLKWKERYLTFLTKVLQVN